MTNHKPTHITYAGRVVFPRTILDLRSTANCPACFEPLRSAVCSVCSLDLNHPSARELAATSSETANLLERRLDIIGLIRFDTSHSAASATPAVSRAVARAVAPATRATPATPVTPVPPVTPVARDSVAAVTWPQTITSVENDPRRSGIQVVLLLGGITLLSLAAIAFLIFAFVNNGLLLRSLIIAIFTAAMFVLASFLRRRKLGGTAEGIAVFAAVLVYLDAWAVRSNDLAGAATVDGATYWGLVLVVSAAAFVLWHRVSGFRAPSIIAFTAVVPGAGLLAYGLASTMESPTRVYLAALIASLAGISHVATRQLSRPLIAGNAIAGDSSSSSPHQSPQQRTQTSPKVNSGTAEKILSLIASASALTVASLVAPWSAPAAFWGGALALAGVALVGFIHGVTLVLTSQSLRLAEITFESAQPRARRGWGRMFFTHYFAALSAIAAATAALSTFLRSPSIEFSLIVPLVSAVCVAGIFDVLRHIALRRDDATRPSEGAARPGEGAGAAFGAGAVPPFGDVGTAPLGRTSLMVNALRTSALAAAIVGGLIAVVPLTLSAVAVAIPAVRALMLDPWRRNVDDILSPVRPEWSSSVLALTIALVLLVAFSGAAGRLRVRAVALTIGAAGIAVAAVPLTETVWTITVGWLVIAAIGIAVWSWTHTRVAAVTRGGLGPALNTVVLIAALTSLALGYAASWASSDSWMAGSGVAIIGLIVVRWGCRPTAVVARTIATFSATVILIGASWALAQWLVIGEDVSFAIATFNGARVASIFALCVFVVVAVISARLISDAERRSLFWLTGFTLFITVSTTTFQNATLTETLMAESLMAEPLTALLVNAATLGAVMLWAFGRATRGLGVERSTATVLVVPALYAALHPAMALVIAHTGTALNGTVATMLIPAIAVIVGTALSLSLAVIRPAAGSRLLRDVGAGLVGIVSLMSALWHSAAWIALIILGVAALLIAIDRTGLFASTSPRKHVGWLALTLATGSLWVLLADSDYVTPEPFVLPVAGALLLIAALVWRAGHASVGISAPGGSAQGGSAQAGSAQAGLAVPALTFGGLIVGILPVAIVAADGPIVRTIAVGLGSAVILIAASYGGHRPHGVVPSELRPDAQSQPLLVLSPLRAVAALAGLFGVITTVVGRAASMLRADGTPEIQFDVLLAAGSLTLAIAAFGRFQPTVRTFLAAASLTLLAIFEIQAFTENLAFRTPSEPVAEARALALLVLLASVYVIATAKKGAPFTPLLGAWSLGLAVITALAGLASQALNPVETATIPVSLALITAGAITLRRVATTRSWPTIGIGLLLFVVPSLLATVTDRPYWRVIAIAIVAIIYVIIGLLARLKAPFIIGAIVILVHGLATFSPQIRAVFEAGGWFSWIFIAAAGGTILTVFAARTEKSLRTARNTIARIAELR